VIPKGGKLVRLGRALAPWFAAVTLSLILYWDGLKCWFRQDDFAWLTLASETLAGGDFWRAMFSPMAQGTIRPLGERAFFLAFYGAFGLDAIPFRIWVFLTQAANLVLLGSITARLTKNRAAGWLAPALWLGGGAMYVVMTWTSAYNQVLCGFCLLLAFHFLLRWMETGKSRYYWLQWAPYLAGLGVLEVAVVYPVLVVAYCGLLARRFVRPAMALFVPAVLFMAVRAAVEVGPGGVYQPVVDGSMLNTLARYWAWAMGPALAAEVFRLPGWLVWAATLMVTIAVLGFAGFELRRGRRLPVFLLAWFAVLLAPVLPLKHHVSDYYLTLPTMGLAMLGAQALSAGWKRAPGWRAVALITAAVYLLASVPAARISARGLYLQTREVKKVLAGVARAAQHHPGKVILLAGVDNNLFWDSVYHRPFPLVGAPEVYLAPGAEAHIEGTAGQDFADFVTPPGPAFEGIEHGLAVVYDTRGPRLRNITPAFAAILKSGKTGPPARVHVRNPLMEYLLGTGWYPTDPGGTRWAGRRAEVLMAAPASESPKLNIHGFCPDVQVAKGPLEVVASISGLALPPLPIREAGPFHLSWNIPAGVARKETVQVTVEVDHTFRPPASDHDLGLAFEVFEIR
jgi:hypothetical protein